jgi:hypothetical protein
MEDEMKRRILTVLMASVFATPLLAQLEDKPPLDSEGQRLPVSIAWDGKAPRLGNVQFLANGTALLFDNDGKFLDTLKYIETELGGPKTPEIVGYEGRIYGLRYMPIQQVGDSAPLKVDKAYLPKSDAPFAVLTREETIARWRYIAANARRQGEDEILERALGELRRLGVKP